MRVQLVSLVTHCAGYEATTGQSSNTPATCLTVCVLVVHLFLIVYFSASPEKEHEGLFAVLTLQT